MTYPNRSYFPQLSRLFILLFALFIFNSVHADSNPIQLPLAHVYKQNVDLKEYWLSEKLDGVRAYWDGKQFLSKQGNIYYAPDWFIADFPAQHLDGELWIGRNKFEQLVSVVRDKKPSDQWRNVRYMVFDMPLQDVTFTHRIAKLKKIFEDNTSPYLQIVEQEKIFTHGALIEKLNEITQVGGEGLMLHRGESYYRAGRSNNLLKVKLYRDAEARVVSHLPGKGKYSGMLGSLLVEIEGGKRFRLGSGLSDEQRRNPPPIGVFVTYKYYGKTKNGLPRFASFLRVRNR